MAKAFWKLFCQFLLTQLCFFNPLAPTAQAKIALEDSHLVIDGVKTFLYGGDFQYFRIRDRQFDEGRTKELWAKTIIAMREAGLNLALVYVPWDYHERE